MRFGLGDKHAKEAGILNRILRISEEGIRWEADPRHAELLGKSLGLEPCKFVGTPGSKCYADEAFASKDENKDDDDTDVANDDETGDMNITATISSLNSEMPPRALARHSVNSTTTTATTTCNNTKPRQARIQKNGWHMRLNPADIADDIDNPYSTIYGAHPAEIVAVGPIGDITAKRVLPDSDPYTGRRNEIMNARMGERGPTTTTEKKHCGTYWERALHGKPRQEKSSTTSSRLKHRNHRQRSTRKDLAQRQSTR